MSHIAEKIIGCYVDVETLPPVREFIQRSLRSQEGGMLGTKLESFAKKQPFPVSVDKLVVDSVSEECVRCRFPAKVQDHENTSYFRYDVLFDINPRTGDIIQIDPSDSF